MMVFEIAGSKQLVLSHISDKNGIIRHLLCNSVDDFTHTQWTLFRMNGRLNDLHTLLLIKRLERLYPFLMFVLINQLCQGRQ